MAREHANVRLDMWGDADWRALTRDAQWLYELLLTHPKTNRAGISEWHPGRLSMMARGTTPADVNAAGAELERSHFVVIDTVTEEVLIRSYVKYDGVLKQPNLSVTMANDWTATASERLRGVVAHEVRKVRAARPELPAWSVEKLTTLLESPGIDVKVDPSVDPKPDPSVDPSVEGEPHPSVRGHATSTTTSTSTEASLPAAKKPELRIPKTWTPTVEHVKRAKESGVDIVAEEESFRLHAETHDRHAANWNAAFTTWLKKAKPTAPARAPRIDPEQAWRYR